MSVCQAPEGLSKVGGLFPADTADPAVTREMFLTVSSSF